MNDMLMLDDMIDEIHDMLIDHMNEDSAGPILQKIRELADTVGNAGYELGCEETKDAYASMNDEDY